MFSYVVNSGNSEGQGETATRRCAGAAELADCAPPNIRTVYDALQHRARMDPDKLTMGQRPVLDIIRRPNSDGRPWTYFTLGEYEWLSYRQVSQLTRDLGCGLKRLQTRRLAIYAPTSREWTLCMLAAYSQAIEVVTAYDTLGADGLLHALNETGAETLVIKAEQMETVARIGQRIKSVKTVVVIGDKPKLDDGSSSSVRLSQDVVTFDGLCELGQKHPSDIKTAQPADTALVMYTSGTTGPPKGALISHQGIMSVCGAINQLVPDYIDFQHDIVLSYLPLSHVLAFFVETYCVYSGLSIGYGGPRTLTEDNMVGCLGDIRTLRPHVMLGVPQVWNTIRNSILRQVEEKPAIVQHLFNGSVWLKTWMSRYGVPTWLLDSTVFRRTREGLGGRLKIVITGGAQISPAVQSFIAATVCPMIQGYGITEASGLVAVQIPGDLTLGNIGAPVPSCEIKLVDVPECGYMAKDNRGEMWVRGPSVFKGYISGEEERVVTEDGWLRTGDIAEWTELGQLRVVDRRKNLVKLRDGEYVALEYLESVYGNCRLLDNICVVANSSMARPCALVNVQKAVDENVLLGDLQRLARQNGLSKRETLEFIRVDGELWTPENGMLTAANKLRRPEIMKKNQTLLDGML